MNTQDAINFWYRNLPIEKDYSEVAIGAFTALILRLEKMRRYGLHVNTDFADACALLYLTSADPAEAAQLLFAVESGMKAGEIKVKENTVIAFSSPYFDARGYGGLVFFDPTEMQIFGDLTLKNQVAGRDVKALALVLLKDEELQRYERNGFRAIVDLFAAEKRDFFGI